MTQVTLVDYGMGNLHSVAKALLHCGATVQVSSDPQAILAADRVVLPGVGAFGDGMTGLQQKGLVEPLLEVHRRGHPFLGICLGMQMLFDESEEFGRHAGLAILPGQVVQITAEPGLKIPQIGWNRLERSPTSSWQGTALEHLPEGSMMYFVHSFTAVPRVESDRLADTKYGNTRVSAAVQHQNTLGVQFHPEKSGPAGLTLLRTFLEL